VAFELKYKTRELKIKAHNEQFSLKSQSAQDLGRYDFFRDLERIEHLVKNNQGWTGFAIFLTNDSSYWKPPGRPNISYRDFSMQEGRSVTGKLTWGATAGAGTTKGREQDIWLKHTYKLIWRNYSDFPKPGYSKFRYLALEVMRA
jgi:hypothetical protein